MSTEQPRIQPAKRNRKTLLIVAIVLGLLGAALNWIYVGQANRKTIRVLKVKGPKPITAGTRVTSDMFEKITISGDVAEMKDMVVDADSFASIDQLAVTETLKPGYILMTRSFKVTEEGGLRDSIPPNERALSLNIDQEVQAVGYNVKPGVMVDVWGDVGIEPIPIVKNVCVKAIGDAYVISGENAREGRYRSVTIFVPDSEDDIKNLLANVIQSGNKVRMLMNNQPCTADIKSVISPRYVIRPDPKASQALSASKPPVDKETDQ